LAGDQTIAVCSNGGPSQAGVMDLTAACRSPSCCRDCRGSSTADALPCLQQNRERYAFPDAAGPETASGTGTSGGIGPAWCEDESPKKPNSVMGELPLPMPAPARAADADLQTSNARRSQTPRDGFCAWHPGILSYAEAELVAIDAQLRRIEQLRAAIDAFQDQEGTHGRRAPRGPLPRVVEDLSETGTSTSSAGAMKSNTARESGRRHYLEHKMTKEADMAEDTDAVASPRSLDDVASNRLTSSLDPSCQEQQRRQQRQNRKQHRLQQLLRDGCCGWHWRNSTDSRCRRIACSPTCFTALLGS